MPDLDPQLKEFLAESAENLDRLDRDFVALEQNPQDRTRLASVFRTIHTIKGTCGFFGLRALESVTHVGENLLSRLRDGELLLTTESATALLAMVDVVRSIFAVIADTGTEGNCDNAALIATLTRLAEQPAVAAPPAAAAEPVAPTPAAFKPTPEEQALNYLAKAAAAPPSVEAPPPARPSVAIPVPVPRDASRDTSRDTGVEGAEGNVRIAVAHLDRLMNLVGELVLARNQILQHSAVRKEPTLARTAQRLNLITTELQEGVMKTRMQPISTVWSRFPRVVRDLAAACGKQVRLEMEGQGTELDRTVIEAIKDPLTHVVRNAVDHGIELPDARTAAGKPAEGVLLLRAFHEGGQVNIDITDDGRGIDPERVKAKALERGLIDAARAATMTERELIQLVFLPGFSTAEKVSNISGRGVGMDVVKTNVEKIGGTIDLQSRLRLGTTMRVKIPLTLAIIPALVVTSGGGRYCIPQVNLLELVRLNGDRARRGIETVHSAPVYRLRDRLLPLVDLGQKLCGRDTLAARDVVNIVVVQADQRPFGLIVDGVNDTEEIVVKPLARALKGVPVFAGATIMGDGKVSLILDVPGLAREASVVAAGRDPRPADGHAQARAAAATCHLLVAAAGARRVAIPLSLVSRLEDIPVAAVEDADGREVIQYRGRIMPLVRLGDVLGAGRLPAGPDAPLQVVVYARDGRSVGLVVDRIIDVTETAVELTAPGRRGVLGSGVVQGRVTDLLDLPEVVRAAVPEFAEVTA
jgi:two-component system chemotaxis sensor kinase CheA